MWEKDININEVKEIRTRTTVYFGVGAIKKIDDIAKVLKGKGIDKVIVMSGRNAYKATGAWDYVEKALKDNGIGYVNYAEVTPNPNTHHVNDAAKLAKDFGAKAVIAIGGGSPTDAGKSVAILLEYPEKTAEDIYDFTFAPEKAAPIVSINLTHGTGTETNRFAVVTNLEKNFKPATSAVASPYSISLAKQVIELVAKYLPKAIANPEDLEARYYLAYAAMMGGVSFDNGLLHYTHALEHPLSAVKPELAHGLGLAILLPAVVKTIYKDRPHVLAEILAPIAPGLTGEPAEADKAAKLVQDWLFSVDVKEKLEDEGFTDADVERLTDLVYTTPSLGGLIDIAPSGNGRDVVREIYKNSVKPL